MVRRQIIKKLLLEAYFSSTEKKHYVANLSNSFTNIIIKWYLNINI